MISIVIPTYNRPAALARCLAGVAAMNGVYATYFNPPAPARATVQVSRLPKDARLEIDVIAVIA